MAREGPGTNLPDHDSGLASSDDGRDQKLVSVGKPPSIRHFGTEPGCLSGKTSRDPGITCPQNSLSLIYVSNLARRLRYDDAVKLKKQL